jgi:1-acyl-sn-glycerol-3-phosphate acyltransferase
MEPWNLEPARDHGLKPAERMRSLQRENGIYSNGMHLAWWTMVRSYLAVWHRL